MMKTCDRCKGETTLLHEINSHWLPKGAPVTRFCQHCTDVVDDAISKERDRTGIYSFKFKLCKKRLEKKFGAKDHSAYDQQLRHRAHDIAVRWHFIKLHKAVREAVKPIR
jgi:hypothetical protein